MNNGLIKYRVPGWLAFLFNTLKVFIRFILASVMVQILLKKNMQKPILLVAIYSATHLVIIFLPIVMNNIFLYILRPSCDQNTDVLETAGWVREAAVSSPCT